MPTWLSSDWIFASGMPTWRRNSSRYCCWLFTRIPRSHQERGRNFCNFPREITQLPCRNRSSADCGFSASFIVMQEELPARKSGKSRGGITRKIFRKDSIRPHCRNFINSVTFSHRCILVATRNFPEVFSRAKSFRAENFGWLQFWRLQTPAIGNASDTIRIHLWWFSLACHRRRKIRFRRKFYEVEMSR